MQTSTLHKTMMLLGVATIALAACGPSDETDFGSMPAEFLNEDGGTAPQTLFGNAPAGFLGKDAGKAKPGDGFVQQMLKTSWSDLSPIGTAYAGNHNGGTDPRGNPTGETAGANGSTAGGYAGDGKVDFFLDRWVRTMFPNTSYSAFGGMSASWLSSTQAKQQGFMPGFLSGVRNYLSGGYVYNAVSSYQDTGRYTGGGGFVAEHLTSAGQAARAGF